jgi:hypothetical protein
MARGRAEPDAQTVVPDGVMVVPERLCREDAGTRPGCPLPPSSHAGHPHTFSREMWMGTSVRLEEAARNRDHCSSCPRAESGQRSWLVGPRLHWGTTAST